MSRQVSSKVLFFALTSAVVICPPGAAETSPVRFDRDIRPILSENCFRCHGLDREHRKADLRLDVETAAKKSVIVAGNPENSELIRRVTSRDPELVMPPAGSGKNLTVDEIDLLRRWIEQGAGWTRHWAFVSPERPSLSDVDRAPWPRNAIDHFVLERLDLEGLAPAPESDRPTLIRRLTLDLTGLPPTLEQVDAFVHDRSGSAYQTLVDRLLNSPDYGERMAVMWLDIARYGDTSVHHADGPRDMWAWRDRVVEAYNDNVPFDEFSIEQLAGDLLPNAGLAQKISAGFNRNNATTDEGGLIEEEYRVAYAVDRVKTTSMAWLGLTMECGQCHDHKYDPISQEDFYRFYAFFNISADKGSQTRAGNAEPLIQVPDPFRVEKLPEVLSRQEDNEKRLSARRSEATPAFKKWLQGLEDRFTGFDSALGPNDPSLHLAFDERDGQTAADNASRGRHGRVDGKPQWVKGRTFGGLRLDGETFVEIVDAGDFERDHPFSLGGWVRVDEGASGALLSRMADEPMSRGHDLSITEDGRIVGRVVHTLTSPDNAIEVTTKRKIVPETWHHVFLVYDGHSKAAGVTIFVDGDRWGASNERDSLTESIRTEKPLTVGGQPSGAGLERPLRGVVDEVRLFDRALAADEIRALVTRDFVTPILGIVKSERTDEQRKELSEFYLRHSDGEYRALLTERRELKSEEGKLREPLTSVMVMADMENPRATFVLNRGAYDAPTDHQVEPGTPSILPPLRAKAPRNRLGLARWLFSLEHPLTARVAVNRYWEMLFGVGLVATSGDFGSQGEFPSHPKLLDWLATEFRDSGWDVKQLLREIVTSATYRQSSSASPDLYRRDPKNRLLARGPRFRLQGEFVRDNALAVSGLLVKKIGGPGVKPYQPPGLWKEVGLGGKPSFVQDHGEKLYRRSLYTYWKRSAPPPSLQIFDAPTREQCIVNRPRTNTPLQALVTMNDVQFVEAARHLAQRMLVTGGQTSRERATMGFRVVTARAPSASELEAILEVYRHSADFYKADIAAAEQLVSIGESPRGKAADPVDHAAWTIVASMLLNLDEALTRG